MPLTFLSSFLRIFLKPLRAAKLKFRLLLSGRMLLDQSPVVGAGACLSCVDRRMCSALTLHMLRTPLLEVKSAWAKPFEVSRYSKV